MRSPKAPRDPAPPSGTGTVIARWCGRGSSRSRPRHGPPNATRTVLDNAHVSVPLLQLMALGDAHKDIERLRQANTTLHEETGTHKVELGTLRAARERVRQRKEEDQRKVQRL